MNSIFEKLVYLFKEKAIWFGEFPPINADPLWLDPNKNFRAKSNLHGKYSVVWIYEYKLFESENWPLLLDEAVLFLKSKGTIVCRFSENWNGTVFALKSYLFRNPSLETRLINQLKTKDNDTVCIFEITRKNFSSYLSKNWSIGILTNGKKDKNVHELIHKLSNLAKDKHKIEFIISGQFNKNNLPKDLDLTIFDLNWNDNLPRISSKKYEIALKAKYENIAIVHDRYQVNDNFFEGFNKYGYHFNFLTVSQSYEDNSFYPGYAGFDLPILKWMKPQFSKNYGKLFPGHYINGGFIIIKRHILKSINFNPLLLHNEAEDVELSFLLMHNGIIPRINTYSSAKTIGISNTHTISFIENDINEDTDQNKLILKNKNPNTTFIKKVWDYLPSKIKLFLRYGKLYNWIKSKV